MSERIELTLRSDLQHPFLVASAKELAGLAERVRAEPLAGYYARMKDWLDEHAQSPLPHCPPGWLGSDFDPMIREVAQIALQAALAWWVEGDDRWLARASEALDNLAGWEYWRSPIHLPLPADLNTAMIGTDVALSYDLLYPRLDEALRQKIQEAILKHCVAFILPETVDRQWWSFAHDGNWSFVTLGGMGLAALAIWPERPEVRPAIETAAGHIQRSLDHIHPLGGWREGPGYAMYAMTHGQLFIDALAAAGDARLAEHPGPARLDDFFLFGMLAPGRPVYFGDCAATGGGGSLLYRRAACTRRGDLQQFADEHNSGGPLSILWRDPTIEPRKPYFDPPSRHFPQMDWVILRSDWGDPDGLVLATKAGTTAGGHQHPDCGTFLLAAYGRELVAEPGIGTYSRDYHRGRSPIKRSGTHNCLLFNGEEQVAREFKGGIVTQFVTQPGYDAVRMELAGAYECRDLEQWNRFFFLLRPDVVVLVDEVRTRNVGHYQYTGMTIEARIHTFCEILIRPFDAVFQRPGATLLVNTVLPPYCPGLGDHTSHYSIGEHEGFQTRHPDQKGAVQYLRIATECEKDPTVMVTLLVPGKDLADAEARRARVELEMRRRRRVEVYYAGRTLVLDWGNRRWQVYWNVIEGRLPKVLQATVGGPST